MKTDAFFSSDRKYRYTLWRIWDETKPYVLFICLNPSTADENKNDRTVTRCIRYAQAWGYGGLCMGNLFALKSTEPSLLFKSTDPVGHQNDTWLRKLSSEAGIVIAAWGNDGSFMNRSKKVLDIIRHPHYLKLNDSGEPAHPLYLSATLKPKNFVRAKH